jgi:rhomboid protease GluP
MTKPDPHDNDETSDMLRNFEREFGKRRDPDGEADEQAALPERASLSPRIREQPFPGQPQFFSDRGQPDYGESQQIPPPQQFQIRLPLHRPIAYMVLLIINVVIFVLPELLNFVMTVNGLPVSEFVLRFGALSAPLIRENGENYRFLTAMFLHANLLHIAFNGFALYSLGREAEQLYGTPRFLALYFLAGLAGGLASFATTNRPGVGASGAIFGLIGGLAVFYYVSRGALGQLARQQLGSLITVGLINLFIGFNLPNVGNAAHVGGMIGGAIAGWQLAPRFEIEQRLFPPVVMRNSLPFAWVGAAGMLVLMVLAVIIIR